MLIKCKANFASSVSTQFGFYGPEGEPQRRIKNGQEFQFQYDDKKHKIEKRDDSHFIGSWIEVLEIPKRKPGPKPAEEKIASVNN